MKISRLAVATSLCLAALGLSACISLGNKLEVISDGGGAICIPADSQGQVAVGMDHFGNSGNRALEVQSVELVDSSNLSIREYGIMDNKLDGFRGALHPADIEPLTPNRIVEPDMRVVLQLILSLDDHSQPGRTAAVEVQYARPGGNGGHGKVTTVHSIDVQKHNLVCE